VIRLRDGMNIKIPSADIHDYGTGGGEREE
jgi:hypothetical protein